MLMNFYIGCDSWQKIEFWIMTPSNLLLVSNNKLFGYKIHLFFLPFLPPVEGVPFGMASACSITDLAALLMCLNLSGPRWIPPYHRLTTTMWLEQSKMSSRWERRPPAWASPSSSQFWAICPFLVRILRVEKNLFTPTIRVNATGFIPKKPGYALYP